MRLINDYQAKEFFMEITVSLSEMRRIIDADHHDPFHILECIK